jgi:hypothetical protein
MNSSAQHQPERGTRSAPRAPHSFFYDRVIPLIVAGLALVLLIILVLTIGALTGVIPAQ